MSPIPSCAGFTQPATMSSIRSSGTPTRSQAATIVWPSRSSVRMCDSDAAVAPDGRSDAAEDEGIRHAEAGWVADAISARRALSVNAWISEKVGNGWIVSRRTSSGIWARMANVACCIHSPASGPSA